MSQASLLILIAVFVPPFALSTLGELQEERTINTPYGPIGPLALRVPPGGPPVWVQPYSGSPNRTDPRATILAARELGVTQLLVWDRAVAMNSVLQRGQMGVVVDYIDMTRGHSYTISDTLPLPDFMVEYGVKPAFCPHLAASLRHTMPAAVDVVYLGVDGPRRETPAEARLFTAWGADVLGYNLVPEVALAQEAGLCYAGLVTISDYSADRPQATPQGEVRASLEQTLQALPGFVQLAAVPGVCNCQTNQTGQ
jgi:5'-methylthioadenosine phosphorylase